MTAEKLKQAEREVLEKLEELQNDIATCPECQRLREKRISDVCSYHRTEIQARENFLSGLKKGYKIGRTDKKRLLEAIDKLHSFGKLEIEDMYAVVLIDKEEVKKLIQEEL
jgi:hypothetical protein